MSFIFSFESFCHMFLTKSHVFFVFHIFFCVFFYSIYKQHYTLGTSQTIRATAETLLITLSSDAKFQLDGNVFENNRLNRIMIQGKGPDFGREQVEINTNAFNGNAGPFPEIEIINVHTVVLHSNAFYCEYFRFFEYIFFLFLLLSNWSCFCGFFLCFFCCCQ